MGADLAKLMKDLDAAVGENSGGASVSQYIDTDFPPLNKGICGHHQGGIPFGRIGEVFGESSTGKTAMATRWMVNAQKMGGVAIFIDWERSFDVDMAQAMGLNTERPYWFYFKARTWEEGNTQAIKVAKMIRESGFISEDAPILVVLDSIASAVPRSKLEKELDEMTMHDTTALARAVASSMPTMALLIEETNSSFVYLNQLRLKPGVVFGDPRTTPGGKSMEFYASWRLALGRHKITEGSGKDKEFAGQDVMIEVVKTKMTRPFTKTKLRLGFDDVTNAADFDMVYSMLETAKEKGLLESSGAFTTWVDGKKYNLKPLAEKIEAEGLQDQLKALFV